MKRGSGRVLVNDGRLKVFTGTANPELTREVCDHLGITMGEVELGRFSNGEIRLVINESVRGDDVYIVQPTCQPVNETIMELLIMVDACRRASARRITVVIPYYGYARQDRKTRGREPITAKLVANLITVAGARRVLTVDLHAGQIQGFFDIPVDHLSGIPLLVEYFVSKGLADPVVVSPDPGGVTRARDMADRLGFPLAIIDKRRPEPNVAEVMNIIGRVQGRTVIILDDMIDTAGTIAQGALALKERGAGDIYVACTHPVLSGGAYERLEAAPIKELVVTNTIPIPPDKRANIRVLSIAPLLAEAMLRIHEDQSVSTLFT